MEMKFNKKNILHSTGIEFRFEYDYILYMITLINDLYYNNKNYTKKQYFKIEEIKEILENIEVK